MHTIITTDSIPRRDNFINKQNTSGNLYIDMHNGEYKMLSCRSFRDMDVESNYNSSTEIDKNEKIHLYP